MTSSLKLAGPEFRMRGATKNDVDDMTDTVLELLGVDEDYQERGIGASLLKWGTDQADQEGLETYLDASEKGKPYYQRRHGFGRSKGFEEPIPDRKEYGSYAPVSLVREPVGVSK
ncbi:hypothetical protein LTR62_002763 [Meristemomyces frigidus]|uniref:N-acetyltransferase domain-containing protein n=1 Tax=Meristemomyces frigidus TaxID=1508187 RepID=A0AAN7YL38_9PEZI|nr:hypothetical protein LTR62_002763 [Meristemomyces frigidus]